MDINIINKTRGVAFIFMFIFHIFVFLKLLTHINYLNNPILNFIGIIARNIFIVLVGVSLYLSFKNSKNIEEYKKKQLLRSIKIYCIAIYITILTYFIIPEHYIVFGVLHFISISILLLYNFVNNIFALISILIICFILSNYKYTLILPDSSFLGTYINGILGMNIYKTTMDSFPLIIWIPKIILGIFIGYFLHYFYNEYNNKYKKNNKITKQTKQKNENIIDLIGKNTLVLYALHIPIIIIIILLFKKTL
tara:strand:- start:160 stop:912 length:753 start_codon:yes stop_codon:yes gene_type:complete